MPTLTSLVHEKPGLRLVFLPESDPEPIAQTLVAMANSEGGTLILGLQSNGRPGTLLLDEDAAGALQAAERLCNPPVRTEWQQQETPTGLVVILRVERSNLLHSMTDGQVLVRTGTGNRALTGQEIQALASTKSTGDTELQFVPGADRDDLDEDVIEEFLERRQKRNPRANVLPKEKLLQQIGAVAPDGTPTVSGMLLFGQDPQLFLPHSRAVFVNFKHDDERTPLEEGSLRYGRREEIGGPLAQIIDRSYRIMWEEMEKSAVVRGLNREEQTEYPLAVVREALVNAVCHRDYTLTGRSIELRMYADRLEITSPGGLPAYITLDNIVDEHYSRNPRIVNGMYQWGYIEELGLGVDRMYAEMDSHGHPPPQLIAKPHRFTVLLQNKKDPSRISPKWESDMNERQIKSVQYIQEHGSITNSEYREICSHVGAETLRLDLVNLVNKGILLKIGDKRGTRYILK